MDREQTGWGEMFDRDRMDHIETNRRANYEAAVSSIDAEIERMLAATSHTAKRAA